MKNRRYEKIKSGLPREEKPKSGLEKSEKAKCPFAKYLTAVFAILIAGTMGGCTLAVPYAGKEGSGDRMIGAFITTEYLDLYDMESYLNDHASSLVNDGSITLGNDSKYEGKLFADVEKGEADSPSEWKISFGNMDGQYMLMPVSTDENGEQYMGNLCSDAINELYLHSNVSDDSEEQELSGTIYEAADGKEKVWYVNPVYQTENSEIYAITGNSYSNGGRDTEGSTMAVTLSGESTVTENGKSQKESSKVTVQFAIMYKPVKTVIYQMSDSNQVLKRDEYEPTEVPDTLKVESETAYIMEETQKESPSGKTVTSRSIVDLNSEEEEIYLEAWYPLDNGFICKKDVEIVH